MTIIQRLLNSYGAESITAHKVPRIAAAALAVVLSTPGVAAAADSVSDEDTTYYISLGDSLASGYQPDVDKDTSVAYTDQLYQQLKQREPGLEHIRLGCTGETTESLIKGGKCEYSGAKSQLDAALKAMAEHNGKVGYVTIPRAAIPRLLRKIERGDRPQGIADNALPLTVPSYIADVRIARGTITLYKDVR